MHVSAHARLPPQLTPAYQATARQNARPFAAVDDGTVQAIGQQPRRDASDRGRTPTPQAEGSATEGEADTRTAGSASGSKSGFASGSGNSVFELLDRIVGGSGT